MSENSLTIISKVWGMCGPLRDDGVSYGDYLEQLTYILITSNLISDIQTWRDKRNDVIHDLAKTNIDYSSLKTTCEKGRELFGKYSAIIMKIKKNIDETGGVN